MQSERPSVGFLTDSLEAVSTTTPNTHVDIDSEEFRENLLAVDTIQTDAPITRGDMASMVNYRTLPGVMVRAQSSSQCISVAVADL